MWTLLIFYDEYSVRVGTLYECGLYLRLYGILYQNYEVIEQVLVNLSSGILPTNNFPSSFDTDLMKLNQLFDFIAPQTFPMSRRSIAHFIRFSQRSSSIISQSGFPNNQ